MDRNQLLQRLARLLLAIVAIMYTFGGLLFGTISPVALAIGSFIAVGYFIVMALLRWLDALDFEIGIWLYVVITLIGSLFLPTL